MVKLILIPQAPFNFDLVASLYSRFPSQCVDLYSQGLYERVLRVTNQLFLLRVRSVGSISQPKLSVEIIPNPAAKNKPDLLNQITWMLGADDDLEKFYKIGLKNKKFGQIIKNLYGLRPPKTPTVFEALIIAITEQQIALPVALSIRKRLVEKYGDSLTIKGQKYYAFPTPEALAKAKPEEIRQLKFTTRKAEYIVGVAQKVASGEINLEEMKGWKKEKVMETLTEIRGLGPWTVEYLMCRGMGRYEALPASDIGLRSSLTKYLDRKERVTGEEVREFLKPFGQHQGYAAFYLIYTYAFQKYPQEKLL